MINRKPDHDDRRDRDPDNDNERGRAIAPAPAASALTSLTALATALNGVDTTSVTGRSGMPMLQFKSREDGTWMFGQSRIVPEDGSHWAVNPLTFMWGFIAFGTDNKVSERVVPITQPKPEVTGLPDKGVPWAEQWTVNLKCLDGADAGTEVVLKSTTDGGIKAIAGLIDAVRDRLNGGQHDGKVSPIVTLGRDSYSHVQHGRIWFPVLSIADWMGLDGPAPAPAPTPAAPPPTEHPRRRRVA